LQSCSNSFLSPLTGEYKTFLCRGPDGLNRQVFADYLLAFSFIFRLDSEWLKIPRFLPAHRGFPRPAPQTSRLPPVAIGSREGPTLWDSPDRRRPRKGCPGPRTDE